MARPVIRIDIRDFTKQLERELELSAQESVELLSEDIIKHIKSNWSPISPSQPYNPPAKVTGFLESSLSVEKDYRGAKGRFGTRDQLVAVRLTSSAIYSAALEYGSDNAFGRGITLKPRPYMEPALQAMSNKFKNDFKRTIKFRLGGFDKFFTGGTMETIWVDEDST